MDFGANALRPVGFNLSIVTVANLLTLLAKFVPAPGTSVGADGVDTLMVLWLPMDGRY